MLLVRLIRSLVPRRLASAASSAVVRSDVSGPSGSLLNGPCGDRMRMLVGALRSVPAVSADAAVSSMEQQVVPLLRACVDEGDPDSACSLEVVAYQTLIKQFELPDHYHACLALVDEPLHRLGAAAPDRMAPLSGVANRLLFSFQNLSSAGAHVKLFCDVVGSYLEANPEEAQHLGVIGSSNGEASEQLRALQARYGVALYPLPKLPAKLAYDATIETVRREQYDRLIVVAMPIGLSYLSGRLPPCRLGWWSMKFELGCIRHLRLRCSIVSAQQRQAVVNGQIWLRAPGVMVIDRKVRPTKPLPPLVAEALSTRGPIFYTINREEKIRNEAFLALVSRILQLVPDARFIWTGRQKLQEIEAYFERCGLASRHRFVGWVHPDDLLAHGHVFLDTPVLSGTVAARAATLGKPVVTLRDSHSWVNFSMPAYTEHTGSPAVRSIDRAFAQLSKHGLRIECADDDEYVATAVRLVSDDRAKKKYGEALEAFAGHYFGPNAGAGELHLANLRSAVSDDAGLTQLRAVD